MGADVSYVALLMVETVIVVVVRERILDRFQLHVLCLIRAYLIQINWFIKGLIGGVPSVSWWDVTSQPFIKSSCSFSNILFCVHINT